jgi:hypothetical protein
MRAVVASGVVALVLAGCVSDGAARRVQIVGQKPAGCRVVDERLRGAGRDANQAFVKLRREAARRGVEYVVVTDGPRREPGATVVDAIGYGCPAPPR